MQQLIIDILHGQNGDCLEKLYEEEDDRGDHPKARRIG
jgi:hypothetical protein